MLSTQKYDENLHVNYSPFGAILYGRNWSSEKYRYGFQGQERDDEVSGGGNSYTAEFWQYSPRLGKRWNPDPVVAPWESPYAVFRNSSIVFNDPDGDCSDCDDSGKPSTHTIKKGETLSEIAKQTGTSVNDLTKWNGIEDPNKIYAGNTLYTSDPNASEPIASNVGSDEKVWRPYEYKYGSSKSQSNNTNSSQESSTNPTLRPLGGPAMILLGTKIEYLKPVGALGSKTGSSVASYTLRKTFPQKLPTRVLGTKTLGGAIGRMVPIIGQIWTAAEVVHMMGSPDASPFQTYYFDYGNFEGTIGTAKNKTTREVYIWNPLSDSSYKKDINPINSYVLSKILQLKVYTYYYEDSLQKKLNLPSDLQVGFLIHEVEKIFPEIVGQYDNGYKYIALHELMPLIVVGIQEQNNQIEELTLLIKSQQKLLEEILARLNDKR